MCGFCSGTCSFCRCHYSTCIVLNAELPLKVQSSKGMLISKWQVIVLWWALIKIPMVKLCTYSSFSLVVAFPIVVHSCLHLSPLYIMQVLVTIVMATVILTTQP